ncbi:pectinesterase family protein [Brevundimonas sp.]|uniref:pectinesterase family protein n=1 Tax=Brevundimonas sp. TaxID=1871086 RepID=UPI0025B8E176|nr:pectinesterase family protein [Brevundimonas sp.]
MAPVLTRRRLSSGLVALAAVSGLAEAGTGRTYQAEVLASDGRPVSGAPIHRTLAAAIAAAPVGGIAPFRILLRRGVFDEQIVVDRPFVHLVGESRTGSVISHLAASGLVAPDGRNWGTTRTPTLTVRAPGFRAERLTIANAFDGLAEMTRPGGLRSHDGAGPQAVSLMLAEGSDRAVISDCDILGYQDTLFADSGMAAFERCRITGSYDFIFGAGRVWFEACEIRSRPRPVDPVDGYVTAPSTPLEQPFGLVFHRCRLTREPGTARHSVYLGRPWRPTKTFSDGRYGDPDRVGAATFLDCWMDDHVAPDGFTEMWHTGRDGNPRTMLQPENARFATHGSRGPGAGAFSRGARLTRAGAAAITRSAVVGTLS